MFCDGCGTRMTSEQQFCPRCGKKTAAVPAQSATGGHVRLLGILWLAISAFRLLPGLFGLFMLPAVLPAIGRFGPPEFRHFIPVMAGIGIFFLLTGALFGFLVGWGLLQKKPWARILALVLGALSLLDIPFGTALGIFTLWVLLPAKAEQEFHQGSLAT